MATMTKEKCYKNNKSVMFTALKARDVEFVDVTFDGSGDSGSIDHVAFPAGTAEQVGKSLVGPFWSYDSWNKKAEEHGERPLSDFIADLCEEILENEHGGWEINEGSFGEFAIDVKKRKIKLTFNTRIESYETDEEDY